MYEPILPTPDLKQYIGSYAPKNELERDFAFFAPLTRESLTFLYNVLAIGAIEHANTREYFKTWNERDAEWQLMDESL